MLASGFGSYAVIRRMKDAPNPAIFLPTILASGVLGVTADLPHLQMQIDKSMDNAKTFYASPDRKPRNGLFFCNTPAVHPQWQAMCSTPR